MKQNRLFGFIAMITVIAGSAAMAQSTRHPSPPFDPVIIVPQVRTFTVPRPGSVQITGVDAEIDILEQAATTAMSIHLHNPTGSRLEAELVLPVIGNAVIKSLVIEGAGREIVAKVLTKEEARRIYNEIVSKLRDPALLEFIGYNLIRTSVFPVEPGTTQTVQLTYEHLLSADGNRVDYVLPRSESVDYTVPWNISVTVTAKQPIATIFSPSHTLEMTRTSKTRITAKIPRESLGKPGAFRLSCLMEEKEGVTASLFAFPSPKLNGGYFLLLAGLPVKPEEARGKAAANCGSQAAMRWEITASRNGNSRTDSGDLGASLARDTRRRAGS